VDSSALQRLPLEAMAGVPASGAGNKAAVDGCEEAPLQSKSHDPRQLVPHCVCGVGLATAHTNSQQGGLKRIASCPPWLAG